jgi:virginiamycin B lyase
MARKEDRTLATRLLERRVVGALLLGFLASLMLLGLPIVGAARGATITEYELPSSPSAPSGLTAGPDGALWFTERIGQQDRAGYDLGSVHGVFVLRCQCAFADYHRTRRRLVVHGAFTNKIGRVTTSGTFTAFPVPTPNSAPVGITAGPDGVLWFTEGDANKIGRVTTSGAFSEFSIPTAIAAPTGITSGPDGALWFTEENARKIGRVTTELPHKLSRS